MRAAVSVASLSAVLLLVGLAPVAFAETFPLDVMGSKPLRGGQLAADADIKSQPSRSRFAPTASLPSAPKSHWRRAD